MITSHQQAVRVQTARHSAGKRGFAKAVARYIKRTAKASGDNLNLAFKKFPAGVIHKTPQKEAEESES